MINIKENNKFLLFQDYILMLVNAAKGSLRVKFSYKSITNFAFLKTERYLFAIFATNSTGKKKFKYVNYFDYFFNIDFLQVIFI